MNGKIIKGLTSRLSEATIVRSATFEAANQAGEMIARARHEAEKILEEAEQAKQAIAEAAYQQGYEAGLQGWNEAVLAASLACQKRLDESEPELIRLALRIAQKIIGEELRINPEVIVSIARECLRGAGRGRSMTIKVPSADCDLVRRRIVLLREAAGPNHSLEVVGDMEMAPGHCVIESEFGIVDARLETQIRCLEEILLRAARK